MLLTPSHVCLSTYELEDKDGVFQGYYFVFHPGGGLDGVYGG